MNTVTIAPAQLDEIIVHHPFFRNLDPRHISLLAGCASLVKIGMRQDILREGESADRFYLIQRGQVAIETFIPRAGVTRLQTLEGGEALGWSWYFAPFRWQHSARALDPVEAVAFDAAVLRERAAKNPAFGYDLSMRLGAEMLKTLNETRKALLEFFMREPEE
jgi:CRP-like cAMP-binding protein